MASTHQETYRSFEGSRSLGAPGFWPIFVGSLRVALKRKLPLLLLSIVPAIATCVVSFFVYLKFAAEAKAMPEAFAGNMGFLAEALARQATTHLEARNQIISFHASMNMFATLCVAWYGSGLICDDRRSGAFQLYFSRPLSRLQYFLGKLLCVSFFGVMVSLVPPLVIFVVASLASHEWAFFYSDWDIVPRSLAFSCVWLSVTCGLALFASSLATRKSFALVGIFSFLGFSVVTGQILGSFVEHDLFSVSLVFSMQSIAHQIFNEDVGWTRVESIVAWRSIGVMILFFFSGLTWRLARLQAVE